HYSSHSLSVQQRATISYFRCFFFSSRRRHTRCYRDWSSDVCSSDLSEEIRRHSIKKSSKRSPRGVVFLRIAHQGHEHILHNLFRGPGVPGHAQRKAVHRRLVPPVQERESLLIAPGGPQQQNVVSVLLGDPHLSW